MLTASATACPSRPTNPTIYARTLHRACLILGGVANLARHLGVDERQLLRWIDGDEEPPKHVFLAAVEVVLLHAEGAGPTT